MVVQRAGILVMTESAGRATLKPGLLGPNALA
jgi:hypothetical protein